MRDIDEMLTLDERSSADFILSLRKRWADTVYPAFITEFENSGIKVSTAAEGETRLKEMTLYPWFSHLERIGQKMMWRLGSDVVFRCSDELLAQLEETPKVDSSKLKLNPNLELPTWYTDTDIHMQPGSFFSDDLSGYVYQFGARIVMLRDNDGYKFHKLFANTALPDLPANARVLDMACGFGKSTRPLVNRYPDAEVIGVDLAAPGLKLAHAEASAEGLNIEFRQEDARNVDLPDRSVDLVTGTMMLHEMPQPAIIETIAEAARLLKPGGVIRFLEFHPTGDPVRDATVYEHAERNNEPYFRDLFATDLIKVCEEHGLTDAKWVAFDERADGLRPDGWPARTDWHFPWCVLQAIKAA
ncbi:MAG: class I SAM-dependent methyltransferase [Candidatus Nanopelagicales bacterium]